MLKEPNSLYMVKWWTLYYRNFISIKEILDNKLTLQSSHRQEELGKQFLHLAQIFWVKKPKLHSN